MNSIQEPVEMTHSAAIRRRVGLAAALAIGALLAAFGSGCAALTNPVARGIPVREVPPELLGQPREQKIPIPMTLLGQDPPDDYRLDAGDVLGIWIEGMLGEAGGAPPVQPTTPLLSREQRRLPPTLGYPIPVEADGKLLLPKLKPLLVKGMTVLEVREAIVKGYEAIGEFLPGKARVSVTLLSPREAHIVVLRDETASLVLGTEGIVSTSKRGNGHEVYLPAYENDVLHALAASGGLPGLDAMDEIIVQRPARRGNASAVIPGVGQNLPGFDSPCATVGGQMIRIPLRVGPGEPISFGPEDVVLHTGDVVFVRARDGDVFFTGGLLPSGEHLLPRDIDLDVVEAITRVKGPLLNGGVAVSNLAGNLISPGIGGPSPSLLTVIRKTKNGGQIAIRVDLDRALKDPRERILVQPGDLLLLQEKPSEALARYFTQTFLNFNLVWEAVHSKFAHGVFSIAAPERLNTFTPSVTLP